jgi:ubiquinone/menaquinone biosynthesis C-methylase UbiE
LEKRKINDIEFVKKQYRDDTGLLIRKKLHENYSVNKQGFGNWLFKIIELPSKKGKILELGSGNGDFWRKNIQELNEFTTLTLSDFSGGMVETMKKKFKNSNVDIHQIDIQDIPFENDSFDVIIGNAMLYHIPKIDEALKEVHRVLKPCGKFYSSTFGENGLSDFISESLEKIGIEVSKESNYTFTLQNGSERLINYFNDVKRLDYLDKLIITDVQDLVDYIFSMTSMNGLTDENREKIRDYFEEIINAKGVIEIPKEYGSFVSTKKLQSIT